MSELREIVEKVFARTATQPESTPPSVPTITAACVRVNVEALVSKAFDDAPLDGGSEILPFDRRTLQALVVALITTTTALEKQQASNHAMVLQSMLDWGNLVGGARQ